MGETGNNRKPTQIGLHSIKQALGAPSQHDEFIDQPQKFAEEFGVALDRPIDRFGMDLTEIQARVMEAVLHGFSLTDYEGNLEALSREELARQRFAGKLPAAYKNVREIPRLKANQSDILRWAGVQRDHVWNWMRARQALEELGAKQYCFYYDRLALDKEREPIRNSDGSWKKESVVAVDTLFTVQQVREERTKAFQYYDITPSVIFLDQRESYFILVPCNWREEVRRLYGGKKCSNYTFLFLMFLRYQYELKRRSAKQAPPYTIRWSLEEIARALRMPSSVYQRKKSRALELLEDAYSVAKQLNYLVSYEVRQDVHIFVLNDEKFTGLYGNSNELANEEKIAAEANKLLELFHASRKCLDPQYQGGQGSQKKADLLFLDRLLSSRSGSQVAQVIQWSVERPYWSSRLSTIGKLVKYFDEAVAEVLLEQKQSTAPNSHREFAEQVQAQCQPQDVKAGIELLSKHVEVGGDYGGNHQPDCISYEDRQFREKLLEALRRYGYKV